MIWQKSSQTAYNKSLQRWSFVVLANLLNLRINRRKKLVNFLNQFVKQNFIFKFYWGETAFLFLFECVFAKREI